MKKRATIIIFGGSKGSNVLVIYQLQERKRNARK